MEEAYALKDLMQHLNTLKIKETKFCLELSLIFEGFSQLTSQYSNKSISLD